MFKLMEWGWKLRVAEWNRDLGNIYKVWEDDGDQDDVSGGDADEEDADEEDADEEDADEELAYEQDAEEEEAAEEEDIDEEEYDHQNNPGGEDGSEVEEGSVLDGNSDMENLPVCNL